MNLYRHLSSPVINLHLNVWARPRVWFGYMVAHIHLVTCHLQSLYVTYVYVVLCVCVVLLGSVQALCSNSRLYVCSDSESPRRNTTQCHTTVCNSTIIFVQTSPRSAWNITEIRHYPGRAHRLWYSPIRVLVFCCLFCEPSFYLSFWLQFKMVTPKSFLSFMFVCLFKRDRQMYVVKWHRKWIQVRECRKDVGESETKVIF